MKMNSQWINHLETRRDALKAQGKALHLVWMQASTEHMLKLQGANIAYQNYKAGRSTLADWLATLRTASESYKLFSHINRETKIQERILEGVIAQIEHYKTIPPRRMIALDIYKNNQHHSDGYNGKHGVSATLKPVPQNGVVMNISRIRRLPLPACYWQALDSDGNEILKIHRTGLLPVLRCAGYDMEAVLKLPEDEEIEYTPVISLITNQLGINVVMVQAIDGRWLHMVRNPLPGMVAPIRFGDEIRHETIKEVEVARLTFWVTFNSGVRVGYNRQHTDLWVFGDRPQLKYQ